MIVKDLSINCEVGEPTIANITLHLNKEQDKEIIAKIMQGVNKEISMSFKPESWDQEEQWIKPSCPGKHAVLNYDNIRKVTQSSNPCAEINLGPAINHKLRDYITGRKLPGVITDCDTGGLHPPFTLQPYQRKFLQEYEGEFNMNTTDMETPHTQRGNFTTRNNSIIINGQGMTGALQINDEDAVLTINLPGIPREELEIKRIGDILRIRVNPAGGDEYKPESMAYNTRQLYVVLGPDEIIENTKLDLGILTVTIDRGRDVEDYVV